MRGSFSFGLSFIEPHSCHPREPAWAPACLLMPGEDRLGIAEASVTLSMQQGQPYSLGSAGWSPSPSLLPTYPCLVLWVSLAQEVLTSPPSSSPGWSAAGASEDAVGLGHCPVTRSVVPQGTSVPSSPSPSQSEMLRFSCQTRFFCVL